MLEALNAQWAEEETSLTHYLQQCIDLTRQSLSQAGDDQALKQTLCLKMAQAVKKYQFTLLARSKLPGGGVRLPYHPDRYKQYDGVDNGLSQRASAITQQIFKLTDGHIQAYADGRLPSLDAVYQPGATEDERAYQEELRRYEANLDDYLAAFQAMEKRWAERKEKIRADQARFRQHSASFDRRVAQFDEHVAQFDEHVAQFDEHVAQFDAHVAEFDARSARMDEKLASNQKRLDRGDEENREIRRMLDDCHQKVEQFWEMAGTSRMDSATQGLKPKQPTTSPVGRVIDPPTQDLECPQPQESQMTLILSQDPGDINSQSSSPGSVSPPTSPVNTESDGSSDGDVHSVEEDEVTVHDPSYNSFHVVDHKDSGSKSDPLSSSQSTSGNSKQSAYMLKAGHDFGETQEQQTDSHQPTSGFAF